MKIRKDDMVVVLSGKDNYTNDKDFIEKKEVKAHKVLSVDPKGGKAVVEGVNVATKHRKPRNQQEEGGIIKMETPIYVSKVQLYCPACKKGVRVGFKIADGKKTRVCKSCGAEL